jgi:hypothetical protein
MGYVIMISPVGPLPTVHLSTLVGICWLLMLFTHSQNHTSKILLAIRLKQFTTGISCECGIGGTTRKVFFVGEQ